MPFYIYINVSIKFKHDQHFSAVSPNSMNNKYKNDPVPNPSHFQIFIEIKKYF